MHLLIVAATLATAALACSPPTFANRDDEEIPLPPATSKSAKRDAGDGLEGGASIPPDGTTSPPAPTTPTLCDISTAAGGSPPLPDPPAPLPGCANPQPFNPSTYETEIGAYSGPGSPRAACSPSDIEKLTNNTKVPGTWAEYRAGLSPTCDACVFTKTTDTRWGAVVLIGADPKRGFANFGACHAAVNESAECGRAFQYDQFCVNEICSGCAGTTHGACVNAVWAQGGRCFQTHQAITQKCAKLAGSNKLCGTTLAEHAKIVCGGC
jgi:hypothetical protein